MFMLSHIVTDFDKGHVIFWSFGFVYKIYLNFNLPKKLSILDRDARTILEKN